MSIIDTLITDRAQADVEYAQELNALGWSGMSAEQKAEYLAGLKGAYNVTDLNRVTAAMDYLYQLFTSLGYGVPGYAPVAIAHPPQYAVPSGYTQLQYIESSGTQYIDTGYKPNQDTTLTLDAQLTGATTGNDWLFGVRKSVGVDSYAVMMASDTSVTYWFGNSRGVGSVPSLLDRFTAEALAGGLTLTYADTSVSIPNSAPAFQSDYTLFLFNISLAGSPASATSAARLYSCSIEDDGTVVRSFVPCINPSGEAGLYDTINDVFYGNSGTGDFTAGPAYIPPVEDPYTWYAYDIPKESEMTAYLANVSALRGVLAMATTVPPVPADMAGLTYQEANNIEIILTAINDYLVSLQQVFQRAGMSWAVAGGPGFYFAN